MEQKMFCYQCQETAGCKGCTMSGVCGKKPDVAAVQDLLVYVTKGISAVTTALRQEGKQVSAEINHLITLNLFTTITNANFDKESIEARIRATLTEKEALLAQVAESFRPARSRKMGWLRRLGGKGANSRRTIHQRRGYPFFAGADHLRPERTVRLLKARKCAAKR